jgi:hypothetical protein
MELSLKVSGKHLAIGTAVIAIVVGMGLGYRSYSHHKENEAALAAFNQQVAAFDSAFAARTHEFSNMRNPATSDSAAAAAAESALAASAAAEAAAAAQAATTSTTH